MPSTAPPQTDPVFVGLLRIVRLAVLASIAERLARWAD